MNLPGTFEVARSGNRRRGVAGLISLLIASVGLAVGCKREQKTLAVIPISPPIAGAAVEPNLSLAADGRLLLSWVEPGTGGGKALRFSALAGSSWSPSKTVYAGSKREDSPSEGPVVTEGPDHRFYAAWTQVSLSTKAAYKEDIFASSSADGGQTWSAPRPVNQDHTTSEHGYLSLAAGPDGNPDLLWLDGREDAQKHRYHLMSAGLNTAPTVEQILDDDVCTCCPTAMVATPHGLVAAYRDHQGGEIRDISVVRSVGGKWLEPQPVSHDGWRINGCPTNGPALAAHGSQVALAWFTAANDQPAVKISVSADEGASWSKPVVVSSQTPLGRAAVALLPDGSAVVLWVGPGKGVSQLLARRVGSDGHLDPVLSLSTAGVQGRPRARAVGDQILAAWAEGESAPVVKTAFVDLK
jgi:hypothetical protein